MACNTIRDKLPLDISLPLKLRSKTCCPNVFRAEQILDPKPGDQQKGHNQGYPILSRARFNRSIVYTRGVYVNICLRVVY